VPEVLRRRFESHSVGYLATIMLLFFMFFFLMAQFKAGAEIMATLLEDAPVYQGIVLKLESLTAGIPWVGAAEGDYLLCLIIFATSVIIYTTYGGFRAVVWTDVMQGLVMLVGVILMLVFAIRQVDGLGNARQAGIFINLHQMTARMEVQQRQPQLFAALHFIKERLA
jgi:Na+/pantothenate symporter